MLDDNARRSRLAVYKDVPSYTTFLQSNLKLNAPCVIGPDLVANWRAFQDWVTDESPNWKYFKENFGSDKVSVADCATIEFGDQCRVSMLVSELASSWIDGNRESNHYLKDWHLQLRHPRYEFYHTPEVFRDDWMNDYYINSREEFDDFRFVYMGVKGTFTPLHRDVYGSYSWSTNVVGSKRWTLFPPSVSKLLYANKGEGTSKERVFDVREYNHERFPEFSTALREAIVVIQKPQETIFVPSGWYHQVENLTDCISINHNWANGSSLKNMYQAMCDEIEDVERALSDVRQLIRSSWKSGESADVDGWQAEWTAIVQDVLVKNSGWGWLAFWKMVLHAVNTRFMPEKCKNENVCFTGWRSASTSSRPPWKDEIAVIKEVLEIFKNQRREAYWILELSTVIEELTGALVMHSAVTK